MFGNVTVAPLLALERRGDVALAVPCCDEHERYDVDAPVAGRDQPRHGVLDGRRRQLEEAASHVGVRQPQLNPVDQGRELGAPLGALGAVADDQQSGAAVAEGHGSSR